MKPLTFTADDLLKECPHCATLCRPARERQTDETQTNMTNPMKPASRKRVRRVRKPQDMTLSDDKKYFVHYGVHYNAAGLREWAKSFLQAADYLEQKGPK